MKNMLETIKIPNDVKFLMYKLEVAGFESFVVGGCVRDSLLEKEPKDWDITTNADYDSILRCLDGCVYEVPIANAREHNVCFVIYNHNQYEIATYRTDGEYADHRHTTTEIANSLEQDLSRRDFTCNALCADISGKVIDLFNGREDISKGILRAVGKAEDRINEDALRILRAYRFAAKFDFEIEESLQKVCEEKFSDIKYCSAERRRDEINKLLLSNIQRRDYARKLLSMVTEVDDEVFDELNVCLNDLTFKWAVLLQMSDKVESILRQFKFENCKISAISTLISDKNTVFNNKEDIKRYISHRGNESYKMLRAYQDIINYKTVDVRKSMKLKKLYREIVVNNEPCHLNQLAVNGDDLIAIGIEPGQRIGSLLNTLLNMVIEKPEFNDKKQLMDIVRGMEEL